MKIVWTIVRTYSEADEINLKKELISDLIELGVPGELADSLSNRDNVQWAGVINDSPVFIRLDLLKKKTVKN